MQDQLSGTAHDLVVSYRSLRRAIGTVGFSIPLLLGPVGLLFGVEIQDTMSSYYHTELRDYFVGSLFSLCILLVCYRGYSRIEAWTANLAAFLGICIAIFPLDAKSDPLDQHSLTGYLHTLSGGAFFVVLAVYSLYHFPRSGTEGRDRQRSLIYKTTGVVLLTSVVAMGGMILFARGEVREAMNHYNLLFWLEWVAIWSFAGAWLTKGRTIVTELAAELLAWPMDMLDQALARKD